MGTFIGLSIYVPVYFESALGLSASQSGLALLPLMLGVIAGATLSGRLMVHLRRYKRPPLAGLALAVAGTVVLSLQPVSLPMVAVSALLMLVGAGIGTVLPVTTVAIQNAVPMHQLGTATGTMSFFRSLGGAVAVAGFGAIVLGGMPEMVAGVATGEGMLRGADLAGVFRELFRVAAAGFAVSFVCLAVMAELPLRSSDPQPARPAVTG
jgi:MFS family permease